MFSLCLLDVYGTILFSRTFYRGWGVGARCVFFIHLGRVGNTITAVCRLDARWHRSKMKGRIMIKETTHSLKAKYNEGRRM